MPYSTPLNGHSYYFFFHLLPWRNTKSFHFSKNIFVNLSYLIWNNLTIFKLELVCSENELKRLQKHKFSLIRKLTIWQKKIFLLWILKPMLKSKFWSLNFGHGVAIIVSIACASTNEIYKGFNKKIDYIIKAKFD